MEIQGNHLPLKRSNKLDTISFQAIILGSGTIVPSLERSACSVLLKIGSQRLILDTGPGTIRRLLRTNTSIFDVSYICYSHFHPDHIAELVPFLFGLKYPDSSLQKTPLVIAGGKGFKQFFNGLKEVLGDWMTPEETWLKLIEIDRSNYYFKNFELRTARTEHRPESLAYRIQLPDGRSVVYSGDTDYCENLVNLAHRTDLLLCECSTPDESKCPGHLTPSLAGTIAQKAGVKKLVLTHLYPECEKVDLIAQAGKIFTGPIVVAEDLMTFEI